MQELRKTLELLDVNCWPLEITLVFPVPGIEVGPWYLKKKKEGERKEGREGGGGRVVRKRKEKKRKGKDVWMEEGRGNGGKKRGENRRKGRGEKVMEEAVVTGILQPTGRKLVRYKHTMVRLGKQVWLKKGSYRKRGGAISRWRWRCQCFIWKVFSGQVTIVGPWKGRYYNPNESRGTQNTKRKGINPMEETSHTTRNDRRAEGMGIGCGL